MDKNYVQYACCAIDAWKAQRWEELANYSQKLYSHFVRHPEDLLAIQHPQKVGRAFFNALGFNTPDEDIQEVRAENAVFCFYKCLDNQQESKVAAMRLFLLFSVFYSHLKNKLNRALSHYARYNVFDNLLPSNALQLYVLAYLSSKFENSDVNILDNEMERTGIVKQLQSFQDISQQHSFSSSEQEKGGTILRVLYEDILDDVKQYINYNNSH